MNINSIIEQILGNSATGTKGNIELKDNSHLWDLIHKNHESESGQGNEFLIGEGIKGRYEESIRADKHRFHVTYFIYSILVYLIKLMICGFYKVTSFIRNWFTGDKRDLSQSPRFNFIVFITACTFYIMLIVAILIFFIKSVLLFKTDARVNEYGAISMPQSCERENYMFLLNTATFWDNSGIKVIEGDEVSITVSGSFFSDIDEMYKSALNNKKPKFDRTYVTFDKSRESKPDTSVHSYFLLTNIKDILKVDSFSKPFDADKESPTFGSLLVAIRDASEHKPFNQDSIFRKKDPDDNKPLTFIADRAGYLNFAVNDEYFDKTCFNIVKDSINLQTKLEIYNIARISKIQYETFKKTYKEILHPDSNANSSYYYFTEADLETIKKDTVLQTVLGFKGKVDTLTSWATWNEDIAKMWYSDNVGDILINVRIKRNQVQGNIFKPSMMTKSYRMVEDFFLTPKFWENKRNTLILFVILVILWLSIDYCHGISFLRYVKDRYCKMRDFLKRLRTKGKALI